MTEKENVHKKADDIKPEAGESKVDDQPKHAVHNPFEEGAEPVTPEELDNLEQFKEAQTERD